jgi:hypothetical protein
MMIPTQPTSIDRTKPPAHTHHSVSVGHAGIAPQQQCPVGTNLCHCEFSDTCCAPGQGCQCFGGFAQCL